MISEVVGQLTQNEYGDWKSSPIKIPYLDNQLLTIVFPEAEDETYFATANHVMANFLKLSNKDRIAHSKLVLPYYNSMLTYGYTTPLLLKKESDIWTYIFPSVITIEEDSDGQFYLIISCECTWEEEHGLQLVFKSGQKLTRVSGHDGHFTDNDDAIKKKPWWKIW